MSNIISEDEAINTDQITSHKNIDCHENLQVVINEHQNENFKVDERILNEKNYLSRDKITYSKNDNIKSHLSWRDLYPQVLASCVSLLIVIQPGINLAYSNNLLLHMPSLNKRQFSWITSILALCTPVGSFLIGIIMDRIGRKKACFWTCLPLLASWLLTLCTSSDSIYMFYASRMFAGIGAGMTTVGIVYVSEISHSSYKQLLLSLNSVFFSGGILMSTFLIFFDWHVVTVIFIGLTFTNMVLIAICMPESPIWLLKCSGFKYTNKAKVAMKQIYPKNNEVFMAEWERLEVMSGCTNDDVDKLSFMKSIRNNPGVYKPMVILMFLLLFQQLSGAYPTISYALPIFKSIVYDRNSIDELKCLAIMGTIRFISALLTSSLSFYIGRKPLLIFSSITMVLSCGLIVFTFDGIPLSLDTNYSNIGSFKIPLPLIGVMLYVFSSSLGVLIFPWTLICELLPTSVRAIGSSLLVSYSYLLMFIVMKVFPYIFATFSVSSIFTCFGVVSLLMAIYVYLFVPETLGKSFQEIEDYFKCPN